MYFKEYLIFLAAIVVCMIFAGYASHRVKVAFAKHDRSRTSSGLTGEETARRLLQSNGVSDIRIGKTHGTLTDHYHPTKKLVNLSQSTFDNDSVAAVAVAAHEIGHVMQKKKGYVFYNLRTFLVPIVNFGSHLAMPLVLLGLVIDLLSLAANPSLGFYIALVGVALYGGSFIFALVTLPVELNASKRAKKMLVSEGVLTQAEIVGVDEVLSAAALTYLASMLTSLVYFLRFLVRVLALFGRRK